MINTSIGSKPASTPQGKTVSSPLSRRVFNDTAALPATNRQSIDERHPAGRLRPWSIAAILLLITGGGYYLIRTEPVPLQHDLSALPLTIGAWSGEALAPEQEPLRVSGADQELVRRYHNANNRTLTLYITYFDSQEHGKKLVGYQTSNEFHRGEVEVTLPADSQNAHKVDQVVVRVGREERFVLFWYNLNGRMVTGQYEAKLWTLWNALTVGRSNGALVAVSAPLTQQDNPERLASDARQFTRDLLPVLQHYLPETTG